MIRTVQAEKVYYGQKTSKIKTCSLFPSSKEAKHVSLLFSSYITIGLLNWHRF